MASYHERHFTGAHQETSKWAEVLKKKKNCIHIQCIQSQQPLPHQTILLYSKSDTQTLKAAKCQLRSGAVSSQAPIRSQMRTHICPGHDPGV